MCLIHQRWLFPIYEHQSFPLPYKYMLTLFRRKIQALDLSRDDDQFEDQYSILFADHYAPSQQPTTLTLPTSDNLLPSHTRTSVLTLIYDHLRLLIVTLPRHSE